MSVESSMCRFTEHKPPTRPLRRSDNKRFTSRSPEPLRRFPRTGKRQSQHRPIPTRRLLHRPNSPLPPSSLKPLRRHRSRWFPWLPDRNTTGCRAIGTGPVQVGYGSAAGGRSGPGTAQSGCMAVGTGTGGAAGVGVVGIGVDSSAQANCHKFASPPGLRRRQPLLAPAQRQAAWSRSEAITVSASLSSGKTG